MRRQYTKLHIIIINNILLYCVIVSLIIMLIISLINIEQNPSVGLGRE